MTYLLDRLIEFGAKLASFEAQQSEMAVLLGSKRMPPISDLKGLLEASAWIAKIDALNVLDRCEMLLKLSGGRDTILRFVEKLVEGRDFARSKLRDIQKVLNLEWAATFGAPCESAPIAEIINRVRQWSESTDRYNEWVALRRSDEALRDAGLSDLADRVANGTISAESAVDELVHARAEAVWRIFVKLGVDVESSGRFANGGRAKLETAPRPTHSVRRPLPAGGER